MIADTYASGFTGDADEGILLGYFGAAAAATLVGLVFFIMLMHTGILSRK